MIDYITGEKFIWLADFVFNPNTKKDFNRLKNSFNKKKLFNGAIVYTHTMYVKELFDELKDVTKKIILISHNCDENVDNSYNLPDCITDWFTTNVDIEDNRIKSIPIGLENRRWFGEHKRALMDKVMHEEKIIQNLVYVNFNVNTNTSERKSCLDYFKDQCSCWVTIDQGKNDLQYFEGYIRQIYSHQFIACPEGNGIDTVRLWESLYMRSIPIVKECDNIDDYSDLPICIVEDWNIVNEEYLARWYDYFKAKKDWNYNKLLFSYWENKIRRYAEKNK